MTLLNKYCQVIGKGSYGKARTMELCHRALIFSQSKPLLTQDGFSVCVCCLYPGEPWDIQVMLVRHKTEGEDQVYAMKMLRKEMMAWNRQLQLTIDTSTFLLVGCRFCIKIRSIQCSGECHKAKPSWAHEDREKCLGGSLQLHKL